MINQLLRILLYLFPFFMLVCPTHIVSKLVASLTQYPARHTVL